MRRPGERLCQRPDFPDYHDHGGGREGYSARSPQLHARQTRSERREWSIISLINAQNCRPSKTTHHEVRQRAKTRLAKTVQPRSPVAPPTTMATS
jgi:hypothetical protein